jgi:hypothetical protein
MRFLAATLIVRRPLVFFGAGFAAALRFAAHLFFIISEIRLRPAGGAMKRDEIVVISSRS